MLFNSYEFMLLFLPTVIGLWWGMRTMPTARLTMLVVASFVFYGWNSWEFTGLLAVSTVIDYVVGHKLHREQNERRRTYWLLASLITNLGMLGYFKYRGLFAESINMVLESLRTGAAIDVPTVILPVGISFYTFQTLSYSIDLYRRQVLPAKSFLHFAAYVSMFPQLIAGPIVRYDDVEDQINELSSVVDWSEISRGIWFFVLGLSQKLLIADLVASGINPLLEDTSSLQLFAAWYAVLGYTIQLYFDFAGYSNMAIGLGLLLGFRFPQNFNSPYKATSIQDFWRRWHMTLSSFLRDYLFIPLGGSHGSKLLVMRNLFIVMFLGGLWHGAGWTFILWGIYHGCLLAAYSIVRASKMPALPKIASIAITFLCVIIGWLIFRSDNLTMMNEWFAAIAGMHGIEASLPVPTTSLVLLGGALCVCWFAPNVWEIKQPQSLLSAAVVAGLLWLCILRFDAESPFLYFQF